LGHTNTPVLISGEPGSRPERELLARTIHLHSPRANATFTKLSWEFLSESFIEAQLFGHEKPQSVQSPPGLIQQTNRGTLYIEELTRFSMATQAKLYAILGSGRFPTSNGSQHHLADVRFIVGTCQPPTTFQRDDRVIPDLRHDLIAHSLTIPPLCDRPNELPEIAHQLCHDVCGQTDRPIPSFSNDAIHALKNYPWPENTEEFTRTIKNAISTYTGNTIEVHDLPRAIIEEALPTNPPPTNLPKTLDRIERSMIIESLQAADGNQTRAAKALGISERLMGLRVRKYDLTPKAYRTKP